MDTKGEFKDMSEDMRGFMNIWGEFTDIRR